MDLVEKIGYVLTVLVLLYVCYLCFLFIRGTMLASARYDSYSNPEKLIIGNVYETKIPVFLTYSTYDMKYGDKFFITKYDDTNEVVTPTLNSFSIKINSGIKFKIIKVWTQMDSDNKNSKIISLVKTTIKILDDIPMNSILEYSEVDDSGQYIKKDILDSVNPDLKKIFDKNIGLKKGLFFRMDSLDDSGFFSYESGNKNPIKHDGNIIKQI